MNCIINGEIIEAQEMFEQLAELLPLKQGDEGNAHRMAERLG